MRPKPIYLLSGIIALTLLLFTLGGALANHGGVSQYWTTFRLGGVAAEVKVFNPTGTEMFVLVIEYNEAREFQSCTGAVLSGGDNTGGIGGGSGGSSSFFEKIDSRSYNEVIAVPTEGPFTGLISKDHSLGVQVYRGTRMLVWTSADAKGFKVRPDVKTCACGELSSFSLSATLLSAFGFGSC